MAASCLRVQQMALVNNVCSILPTNFFSKSDPSAICRISSETRSTMRMVQNNLDKDKSSAWSMNSFTTMHYRAVLGISDVPPVHDSLGATVSLKPGTREVPVRCPDPQCCHPQCSSRLYRQTPYQKKATIRNMGVILPAVDHLGNSTSNLLSVVGWGGGATWWRWGPCRCRQHGQVHPDKRDTKSPGCTWCWKGWQASAGRCSSTIDKLLEGPLGSNQKTSAPGPTQNSHNGLSFTWSILTGINSFPLVTTRTGGVLSAPPWCQGLDRSFWDTAESLDVPGTETIACCLRMA